MAEAENLASAYDILRESGFGGECTATYGEFSSLIKSEERLLIEFVKEYAPSKEILSFCTASLDFYNAEAITKALYIGVSEQKYVDSDGNYTAVELKNLIESEDYKKLPTALAKAVSESKSALNNGLGGMAVGGIFARAKYEYLLSVTKSPYLREILVNEINGVNLLICLRTSDSKIAYSQIIKGGNLTEMQFNALIGRDLPAVKKLFANSNLLENACLGVALAKEGKPFVQIEKQVFSYGALRMIEGRYTENNGTNPFMLYYYKRKNEIACVRTILSGKANGLDSEEIKKRTLTC